MAKDTMSDETALMLVLGGLAAYWAYTSLSSTFAEAPSLSSAAQGGVLMLSPLLLMALL